MIFGHTHSSTCNHFIAGPSDVWQFAFLGNVPLLSRSLELGGSTEEVNEVRVFRGARVSIAYFPSNSFSFFGLIHFQDGETALMAASRHGNFDAARVLLDAGADVTSKSKVSLAFFPRLCQ